MKNIKKTLAKLEKKAIKNYALKKKQVKFTLLSDLVSSRTLGYYQYTHQGHILNFNHNVYSNSPYSKFKEIVIHEYAHLITRVVFGPFVQPHGPQWKSVMRVLGAEVISAKTSVFNFTPKKNTDVKVRCKCKHGIFISSNRATRISNGTKYRCRSCGGKLKLV